MAPLSAYSVVPMQLDRLTAIGTTTASRHGEILGEAAAGKSTGDAMKFMADLVAKLPAGVGYSWTGLSYQEALSSNQAPALYAISLVVVFLALAALYESWSISFSVGYWLFR
ncbi:efflux RND transporter permease subunit [Escherichia coli]